MSGQSADFAAFFAKMKRNPQLTKPGREFILEVEEGLSYDADPDMVGTRVRSQLFDWLVSTIVGITECDPADVTLSAPLHGVLKADSLAMIELIEGIEEVFAGVTIPDDELTEFDLKTLTLGELWEFFQAKLIES